MAAAVSPPKPWEKANGASMSSSLNASSVPNSHTPTSNPTSATNPPTLPNKPSSLSTVVNRTASNYSPYNRTGYGGASAYNPSPYSSIGGIGGAYGGMNSYSSPYSRFGGMGSGMYGAGGYGAGGYGSMYGGMGGMGGGMYGGLGGQPGMMGGGDPNDPNSLTNTFSQSTQATFHVLESLVGAFGGVAQMLESTYMATHSSFFAMVSVAEQFSNLRTTLGSILGIFALVRWLRTLFAKLTGRPPPADATSLTPAAFANFQSLSSAHTATVGSNGLPVTPSKKPFLLFLAAVVGLPYLMTKLIRGLAASQEQQQQQQQQRQQNNGFADPTQQHLVLGPDGHPLPDQGPLDPSKLLFCRALYDYPPPAPDPSSSGPPSAPLDLSIKKGDLVAVLSKQDPLGQPSEWWRCRSRDGRVGYLPGVYLEEIKRRPAPQQLPEHGRLNTLTSVLGGGGGKRGGGVELSSGGSSDESSRANSLRVEASKVGLVNKKKEKEREEGGECW